MADLPPGDVMVTIDLNTLPEIHVPDISQIAARKEG
jgi:hypothetical protein